MNKYDWSLTDADLVKNGEATSSSEEREFTIDEIIDQKAEQYKKKKEKTSASSSEMVPPAYMKERRGLSAVLLVLVIVVSLLVVWLGIGTLMNMGVIPYVDFGYGWLKTLFQGVWIQGV